MWELDHKEGWVLKNWCFQTVVLEKTLESPLDNRELKPVNLKRNQPWIFIGRTEAEAEALVLWQPDERSWLIGKTQRLGKIEGRKRKGPQRTRWLDDIIDSMDVSLSKLRKIVKDWEAWRASVHEVAKTQTQVSNWITTISSQAWTVKREMEERDFEIGHFCAPRKLPPRSSWAGGLRGGLDVLLNQMVMRGGAAAS